MLIKGDAFYREELKELWHTVFGDDYAYINLFFKNEYSLCDTFAEIVDGKVVSVLYLLDCRVDFNGGTYNGKYLYAAATHPDYRSRGLMGKLIIEAIDYCKNNSGIDFISLVPANDGLYDYYGKFGFKTAFYRCEAAVTASVNASSEYCYCKAELTESELLRLMSNFKGNRFYFCKKDISYALDCVKYSDYVFYKTNSGDGYFAVNAEDKTVLDFISTDDKAEKNINEFISSFNGDFTVLSPYNLCLYGSSKRVRYGMIYAFNNVDFNDIYMSYALD